MFCLYYKSSTLSKPQTPKKIKDAQTREAPKDGVHNLGSSKRVGKSDI